MIHYTVLASAKKIRQACQIDACHRGCYLVVLKIAKASGFAKNITKAEDDGHC
jgi:hypothetical protein